MVARPAVGAFGIQSDKGLALLDIHLSVRGGGKKLKTITFKHRGGAAFATIIVLGFAAASSFACSFAS